MGQAYDPMALGAIVAGAFGVWALGKMLGTAKLLVEIVFLVGLALFLNQKSGKTPFGPLAAKTVDLFPKR